MDVMLTLAEIIIPYLRVLGPALIFASPLFALLLPDGGTLRRVLTFRLPLPLFVILGVALWAWLNQNSIAMTAAKNATKELVAGGELAAKEATIKKLQDDLALMTMLKDAAFKRAMEAHAADVAAQKATTDKIEHQTCKGCSSWTKGDLEWLGDR